MTLALQFNIRPNLIDYNVSTDPADIERHLTDEGNFRGKASRVIFPRNQEELSEILYFSQKMQRTLTISANRTSLTGAAIPYSGDVISLEKMDFPKLRWEKNYCYVPAPTNYFHFQEIACKKGFDLPVDPTSARDCSLGGAAATNASGSRSFKYGALRSFIFYLQIILPTGESMEIFRGKHFLNSQKVIDSPLRGKLNPPLFIHPFRNTVKNTTGYYNHKNLDLIDCFIGSEGTLGIFLNIGLQLLSKPEERVLLLVPINTAEQVLTLWDALKNKQHSDLKGCLSGMDYIDSDSCLLLENPFFQSIPSEGFFILEIETRDNKIDPLSLFDSFMKKEGFSTEGVFVADDQKTEERIRDLRHEIPESINQIVRNQGLKKNAMDFSAPVKSFPVLFRKYQQLKNQYSFPVYIFGHIGEQNLHVNLLPKTLKQQKQASQTVLKLAQWVLKEGGALSSEHGIGKVKKDFLKMSYNEKQYQKMKDFKLFWDPGNILNQGNLF